MRVKLPAYGVATWPPPDRCLLPKTVFEDIEKDAKCEGLGGATLTFSQRPFLMLWTAPPPASRCHTVVAVEAITIERSHPCKRLQRLVWISPSRFFKFTGLV